jgi:hypothetical protein
MDTIVKGGKVQFLLYISPQSVMHFLFLFLFFLIYYYYFFYIKKEAFGMIDDLCTSVNTLVFDIVENKGK